MLTCSRKDADVSSVLQHVSCPQKKMEESKARGIQWLSLFFYTAVVFFLPPCNTWRFMPGARCRELIACRCLCAFVFPSFSTRRQLSKPCLVVLGSAQSLRFHFSPLLQHSHLLDLSRNVKYSTVGLIGVCLLFVWICFSLRPLRTHRLHNARICHWVPLYFCWFAYKCE